MNAPAGLDTFGWECGDRVIGVHSECIRADIYSGRSRVSPHGQIKIEDDSLVDRDFADLLLTPLKDEWRHREGPQTTRLAGASGVDARSSRHDLHSVPTTQNRL